MPKIIVLSGPVGWEIRAKDIRAALKEAKGGDVEFHVNSPGGIVYEGIEIYNAIREYPGRTEARITGLAASMMSYIVLAADKVSAYDNATFMIHNALALAIGNHNDMRKVAGILESLSNILAKAYSKKTGKTMEEVKSLMDDETFLFGDEMLHEGFIDELIEAPDKEDDGEDRESAIIKARGMIDSCFARMRESDVANSDLERAVAYLDSMSLLLGDTSKAEHWSNPNAYTIEEYEAAETTNPEAPYPNEHACRVREPGEFQKNSFRRISRKADGKTLNIIIGRLKGKTTTTTQAFRYPKTEWTADQARQHCKRNNGKTFEPASGKKAAAVVGGGT